MAAPVSFKVSVADREGKGTPIDILSENASFLKFTYNYKGNTVARNKGSNYEGALYHVTCRGNERKAIFHDDHDKKVFLEVLSNGLKTYHIVSQGRKRLREKLKMDKSLLEIIERIKANMSR